MLEHPHEVNTSIPCVVGGIRMRPIRPERTSTVNTRWKGVPMKQKNVSRRSVLKGGGAALAGLTVMQVAGPAQAFPGHPDQDEQIAWNDDQADSSEALRHSGGQVLPWLDQPPPNPVPQSPATCCSGKRSTPG